MKALILIPLRVLAFLLAAISVQAQLPYTQSFKNATATGVVLSGNAKLTAAAGIDPDGDGYLRLTDTIKNQVGYVYAKNAFPCNYGLTISFEFYTYKSNATGFNQADGICFFLFDASVNAFRPGGLGGSLGYAQYQYSGSPGMSKGFLGIGIDEFGNFSSASEGRNGGTAAKNPCSVVVRGPGNGKSSTDYPYVAHVQTNTTSYNISFQKFTQRYSDQTSPNYRRIKIVLTPGSSLGTDKGYTISVSMFKGGSSGVTEVPLISNFDYPYLSPAKLQYGFTASTGSETDFHEIRNLAISATLTSLLAAPVVNDDAIAICQGPKALLDVTANDVVKNAGGAFDATTIDLNPSVPGIQGSYADPGKGSYTVDQYGIVTFTPINGFIGTSTIQYVVTDTYGMQSAPANISVTVSTSLGPTLTVSPPAAVCAPQVVDITNAALRTGSSTGATYSYYSNLTDANNSVNNINSTANALSTSGLYFIRADAGVCYAVQPMPVQVSQQPTAAVISSAPTSLCNPGNAPFLANDVLVGTGLWSQVSGPVTPTIVSPIFSVTNVNNLTQGTYTFRWTTSNSPCPSSSKDVVLKVSNTAVAGNNQTLTSTATSTLLQANDPTPGTGVWSQVTGPTAVIATPSSSQTTVSGLSAGSNYTFKWTITNGSCNSASQVTVAVPTTLPVRYLSFTGEKQLNGVLLKWQTASEQANSVFEVEKSTDAATFTFVAQIKGAGTSAAVHAYSYLDEAVTNSKVVYYRLRQVDQDGHASYSNVIRVVMETTKQAIADFWPNPFKDVVHVDATFDAAGTASLRLYDNAGRLLHQQQQAVIKGANNLQVDFTGNMAKGIYFLELQANGKTYRQKLIKE